MAANEINPIKKEMIRHINQLEKEVEELRDWCREIDQQLYKKKKN